MYMYHAQRLFPIQRPILSSERDTYRLTMANGERSSENERDTKMHEEEGDSVESIKEGLRSLKNAYNSHETIGGPSDETKYILSKDRLPPGHYHELARTITEIVLEVSPREVAEIEVEGIDDLLRDRDERAVETLLENGISYVETECNDGTIEGRCSATPTGIEAVLSLYFPGLMQAYFLDSDGKVIAARFEDTLQYYWLPEAAYQRLGEQLESDLFSAVVTEKELEQLIEREHHDR